MILFPYKPGSESSKALADALGIKRISHRNSKFRGNADKVVINWGASNVPDEVAKCNIINKPEAVKLAANKLSFFQAVGEEDGGIDELDRFVIKQVGSKRTHNIGRNHPYYWNTAKVGDLCPQDVNYEVVSVIHQKAILCRTPEFTTKKGVVQNWLAGGHNVVARTILNGNSGDGIILIEPEDADFGNIPDAPLYVKYVPKKQEYRVHVFKGQCVDVQRKARRRDVEDDKINWKIRNHDNGFVFARGEDLGHVPYDVVEQSIKCVEGLGLDFGAVDVIYNDKQRKAYVLEVNTAPGLTGATLDGYVERFKEML